ncbi:hypothetical protein [Streptomyces sp. NBC_00019]|uniref:hypothetical protein n=1 Tax=Streptomyces sp. NBC_00019 TaxID=2975623 RepID=UPI00325031E1
MRRQERWVEAIRVDLRAAFLHTAPWLQTGHREQLINVYLAAFGRGPRPVWMLDRAEQTAMALTCFGGAVVAAALMALLDSGVVGTLEASLGQQLLLLTSVVSVAALLSHPRAAVKAARRMTHPVFEQPSRPTRRFDSGVVALVLAIGFTLVGLPWSVVFLWTAGGQWWPSWFIFLSVAAGMGCVAIRWWQFYLDYLFRHLRRDEELPLDFPTIALLDLALTLGATESRVPLSVKDVRFLCSYVQRVARAIEVDPLPRRVASLRDRSARRALRERHARIAALVRGYGSEIRQGATGRQYRKIGKQLFRRALAASSCDWTTLLESAPEVSLASRLSLVLHRTAAPVVLILAALIVPFTPGVGDAGTGVRTSLVAMAVLFALPVSDGARETVRQTLVQLPKEPQGATSPTGAQGSGA